MTSAEIHLATLQQLAATPVRFLSNEFKIAEVHAAKWAVEEIERLKKKCNSLLKSISNATPQHYPSKDDLKLEVIE